VSRYGYFLSPEEYSPQELVSQARMAEQAGFEALWISDHFHPWLDEQGQSGFVWSLIGAISQVTSLPITTAVTCPLLRQHPAIVAQAAATSALLTGGRFTLGVGTGEAPRAGAARRGDADGSGAELRPVRRVAAGCSWPHR
jgi:G6PDH family F420-dependent oxidoreductase